MISSPPEWSDYRQAPIKGNWLKRWIKSRFRYVDYPFLLAYRGYGNRDKFILQGHVFRGMAMTKPKRHNTAWKNFVALIKMFLVRTVPDAQVNLILGSKKFNISTREDGFFEFEIENHELSKGWHRVFVELQDELVEGQEQVCLEPEVLIEDDFEYGLISDIDDTFLVSHVTKFWRKLYILLTKNAESRKPFKGVVSFYTSLSKGVTPATNPFFYVSSSEWNLYDFLINFMQFHKMPKGVLQLKELKDKWRDFFKKGSFSNHDHKRVKIERILSFHPDKKFVLLGDNGQHDPYIYLSIVKDYPDRIKAVYIRGVKSSNRKKVDLVMREIEYNGVEALQFRKSIEAEQHAKSIGIIN
ncbi:App1 family protein [Owenweeksia hongkongensis]|uniref:App1 family protein n=1 Tax=Owenweeksia hongkongensis TaxID=253245 RepID=UPI003A8DE9ED